MAAHERNLWLACIALAGVLALGEGFAAYMTSPYVAAFGPLAVAGAAVIFWRPVIGVCAAVLAVPLGYASGRVFGLQVSPAEFFSLLTAVAVVTRLVIVGERYPMSQAHWAFAGLTALAGTGLFFAEDPSTTGKILIYWVAFLVIAVMLASSSRKDIELILLCVAICGGALGIAAVLGAGPQEAQSGGEIVSGRATASFAHPNVLAFALILSLSPAIGMSFVGPRWRRLLFGALAIAIVAGLVFTLARGGIIGAAVSLAALMAWRPFRRAALLALGVLGVVVALNFNTIYHAKEVSLVRERLSTLNVAGVKVNPRIRIWEKTPSLIADHFWLGVGEGNYSLVSPRYGLLDIGGLHYDHAHDIFLTIAAETGIFGLAFFVWFVFAVGRSGVRAVRIRGPTRTFAFATGAALLGLLVTSFGEYPPRTNDILALIMFEVGVVIACERIADRERVGALEEPRERAAVATSPPGPSGPGRPLPAGWLY